MIVLGEDWVCVSFLLADASGETGVGSNANLIGSRSLPNTMRIADELH